ncbi:MAG: glycoside hydrolase family 32 protein [Phycisphaeraceae bacterium]|nr:glycoside hydrolase family 32 protein [Phycisphaeraceae bacterium]
MPAPQPAFLDGKAHWVVDTYEAGTRRQQLYFDSAVGPAVTQESPLALGDDYIAVNAFSSTNERNGSRFQIGEVLIVAGLLSTADLENLNSYVQNKWSIQPVSQIKEEKVDYTSKVPQFTFADTLAEQEAQLKTNPLILRYAASRKAMADDPYRPLYHFVSPEGNLNDPNGLCFWQGRWHLFYQAYPPEDPRQHWGHAVSDDLIHWRDLPLAIYPNPEKQCFSGSTYVEDGRVIAMYHGTMVGTMLATSTDPLLLNWKKIGQHDGIVIPYARPGEPALPYNIFDPCIWKNGEYYYALTAGTRPVGPGGKPVRANFLHRSRDLEHWEYLHPFVENDLYSHVGDDGACPYFWPIGDKRHILLHFSHMSGGKYLIGDYDQHRDKFNVVNGGFFNHGPVTPGGVHAPSATPDGQGGVIVIFNMNPARATQGWNQLMTLPMRLTLGKDDQLLIEPAGDFASLRRQHVHLDGRTLPANQEIVLDNVQGNSMEMLLELDPQSSSNVELNVLRSPDGRETTRILFYKDRGYRDRSLRDRPLLSAVSIDSSRSSMLPDVRSRVPETASVLIEKNETVRLHVFIDRSVVEVFVNGRQIVAQRVYPGLPESTGFSLRAVGNDARLLSLDAWQMDSIYK